MRPYNFESILKKFVEKNTILNICLVHIAQFDPQLYIKIIEYPSELIGFFDYILNTFFNEDYALEKTRKQNKIKISFWRQKLHTTFYFDEISPQFFNKMISVYGQIVKLTKTFSELSSILFKCQLCEFETYSLGEVGNIKEPIYCFLCKNFNSFQIFHNRCNFNRIKFFKIRTWSMNNWRKNDERELLVISRNHLFEKITLGDTIKITGILRINPYFDKIKRLDSVFFVTYLDSLCILKSSKKIEVINNFKNSFTERVSLNFSIISRESVIMLKGLTENLKFYYLYQDSSFSGQIGIESIKKTLASLYFKEGNKKKTIDIDSSTGINILINDKNTGSNPVIFKNVFKFLKKFVYIDGKTEEEKKLTFSLDLQDELNDTILCKGKLLKGRYKICFIENVNFLNNDIVFVLKEIIKNQKISIVKSGLNCSIEIPCSLVVTINELKTKGMGRINSKISEKNFYSLVNLFEISYVFKTPVSNFSQNYTLKYFTHAFHDKNKKTGANYSLLEKVGFKSKGIQFILEFKRKYNEISIPYFSVIEIVKVGNILKILSKINLKKKWTFSKNFFETVKILASSLTILRLSKLMAIEDIRVAFLIISESLKSDDLNEI